MGLETRIFVNGTARFGRTGPSGQRGPPPEVVPNIPVGPNRNGPFHLAGQLKKRIRFQFIILSDFRYFSVTLSI